MSCKFEVPAREIASPASLYNFEMIYRLAMTNPLHGGERKKVYGKLVTDLIAGSAHGQIYYFINRDKVSLLFPAVRDGCALTQRIENVLGGSLINSTDRWGRNKVSLNNPHSPCRRHCTVANVRRCTACWSRI